MTKNKPLVAIIMGSDSDWPIMKNVAEVLDDFNISYEAQVVSAHRTPDLMFKFAENAEKNGFQIIIAGAGGAAHLPGMVASKTTLPVLGVPVPSKHLEGHDSLLSIVLLLTLSRIFLASRCFSNSLPNLSFQSFWYC